MNAQIEASKRAGEAEYAIREVMVKADELGREGKKIIPMNIGDPVKYGFDTPPHIKEAMRKAIEAGSNYYSPSEGIRELREAIAEKERTLNGARLEPDDVLVTSGLSEAIFFLMATVVNPGDEILMPGPCYPPYLTYTKFFDGIPVTYRTIEDRGWAPDLADLERKISDRTSLIIIANPSNPCGSVYSKTDIEEILGLAATHRIPVAADEIYDRIVFDGRFTSVASIAKDVPLIGLNGFSKTYLMTGWRLGYLYLQDHDDALKKIWSGIQKLARVRICANTPAQTAALEALRGPQDHIPKLVSALRQRRDFCWKRVNEIPGLSAQKPSGAFYLFPRIDAGRWRDDVQFASQLLAETGVLIVHGSSFDPNYGRDHFRMVFLPEEKMLEEAFTAVDGFMKKHR